MPAILWCYDYGLGIRLGLILIVSSWSNAVLKLAFGLPRPHWISLRVRAHAFENSYGLPSGHAQNAVAVWGRLARALHRRWALGAAAILILLISLSRIYLGVHFPLDLIGGWLAGALLLGLFLLLEGPIARGFARLTLTGQLMLTMVLSLGALWLALNVWGQAAARPIPTEWLVAASADLPTGELFDPRQLEPLFSLPGVFLGLGAGAILVHRWGRFSPQGSWWLRAGRYAVGTFGMAALHVGLAAIIADEETVLSLSWRFVRYAAVGFWISYLAPRAFSWLGLLPPASDDEGES